MEIQIYILQRDIVTQQYIPYPHEKKPQTYKTEIL